MMKYFGIYSKQQVYVGTIVPMPPVMGVRKTSSDIQGMCEHIWLKVLLNKPMQECRDVRVPVPPDKGLNSFFPRFSFDLFVYL